MRDGGRFLTGWLHAAPKERWVREAGREAAGLSNAWPVEAKKARREGIKWKVEARVCGLLTGVPSPMTRCVSERGRWFSF